MILNRISKFFGFIAVHLIILIESALLSLVFMSFPTVFISAVLSLTCGLPEIVLDRYWLIYLCISAIPAVIIFIVIEKGTFFLHK